MSALSLFYPGAASVELVFLDDFIQFLGGIAVSVARSAVPHLQYRVFIQYLLVQVVRYVLHVGILLIGVGEEGDVGGDAAVVEPVAVAQGRWGGKLAVGVEVGRGGEEGDAVVGIAHEHVL